MPQFAVDSFATHEVVNQPPAVSIDPWASDRPLREAIAREGGAWAEADIAAYGKLVAEELNALGFAANENRPTLRLFDRYGHRIDEVEFHPAYHRLMSAAVTHQVPSFGWTHDRPGAHVARMALGFLHTQADAGTSCPLTMTYAAIPSLKHQASIAAQWLPKVTARIYDGRNVPVTEKKGVTIGMGMTEKQGGSDVRVNSTRATPQGARGPGEIYSLVGHKWFFSAPMSDAFLVLAQAEGGLSCFLLPRWLPDGTRNALRLQRLKDKVGDWSNASSEVEFCGALGWLLGEEGRGVANILEMVMLTRQDCMIGSSGLMRAALAHAIHHARHRKAFGKWLVDQPLMRNVLADLALESEAHTALTARVSRAVDASARDENEAALCRIVTPIGKYWVCKRATPFINEAQECLGGIGYVEESLVARLYRQAPLNSIWEGSGNIQCLDVLRAMTRNENTREALFAELESAAGGHRALDEERTRLGTLLADLSLVEQRARWIVERLALALEAAVLVKAGHHVVADAFCETRLAREHGQTFGALMSGLPIDTLLERALEPSS